MEMEKRQGGFGLENEFKNYLGVKYAISFNSGRTPVGDFEFLRFKKKGDIITGIHLQRGCKSYYVVWFKAGLR